MVSTYLYAGSSWAIQPVRRQSGEIEEDIIETVG